MATNFPGSLDSFTNPSSSSTLDSPSHAAQHANINDAMEAVQAKLGTGAGTIGEWTSFTPSWSFSSGTLTLASNSGIYAFVNDLIVIQCEFLVTSITGSGDLTLTLPSAAAVSTGLFAYFSPGFCVLRDANTAIHYTAYPYHNNSTTVFQFRRVGGDVVTHSAPFTWANLDEMHTTIIGRKA